jgi:hypothetical protein
MRQRLLDTFWSEYYRSSDKTQVRQAINRLLEEYRESLDTSSKTAIAIDIDYPIELTTQAAESEGHIELGQILRLAKASLKISEYKQEPAKYMDNVNIF